MKRVCVCVFVAVLVCGSAAAAVVPGQPVSFSFNSIPVKQFAQLTYRDLLGRDFVVSSELLALDKPVSISVKGIEPGKVPAFVDRVLSRQGIDVQEKDGVFFLDVAKPEQVDQADKQAEVKPEPPVDPTVMTLKHRSPVALAELVNSITGGNLARPAGGSALVLMATKERTATLSRLVQQLDLPVPSVEVKASFIEVKRSEAQNRGLSLLADAVSRRGLGVSLDPGNGAVSLRAGSYELLLDALDSDGRFRQVSRSRIVGDELERLALSVGDETPTIGRSGKDQGGNLIQDVVYRPSGVLLDVVARVLGSGRVALQVDGQVSAFQSTRTGVSGSPTLVKRQVKTSVSLADGEVLVIGGLDDSKVSDNRAGFSFLPSTWSNRSKSSDSTELLLVLTASVVRSASEIPIE